MRNFESKPARAAMTLTELLVVIGIASLLLSLAAPLVSGVATAQRLSGAAESFSGGLELARQVAMAENTPIEARFWLYSGTSPSGNSQFALELIRLTSRKPLDKPLHLPTGLGICPETNRFSTILGTYNSQTGSGTFENRPGSRYWTVRFRPDGSVELDPAGAGGEAWTLTLIPSNTPDMTTLRPGQNFATLQIDPVTGRCRVYRPGSN